MRFRFVIFLVCLLPVPTAGLEYIVTDAFSTESITPFQVASLAIDLEDHEEGIFISCVMKKLASGQPTTNRRMPDSTGRAATESLLERGTSKRPPLPMDTGPSTREPRSKRSVVSSMLQDP